MKKLQSDILIVILPADTGRSTIILNREDYLQKCMDHINHCPYQLLKKDPTTKIKTKTLKLLKVLKDNEFIDNKLYYYLKPTDSPAPRFYGQPKIHKPGLPICPIVSYNDSLKLMSKVKITMSRILPVILSFTNKLMAFPWETHLQPQQKFICRLMNAQL